MSADAPLPPGFSRPNACIPDEMMLLWDKAFMLGVEIGHAECMRGSTLEMAMSEARKKVALAMIKQQKKGDTF